MADKKMIIDGCENWVKNHCGENLVLEFSAVVELLEVLKEQESVKPKSKVRHGANSQIQHFCGNCNAMLHGKPKFCSECGKEVLW